MNRFEDDEMLRGQVDIWHYMSGYVDSMVLKCAVDLRIADIIHSYGKPISLAEIAQSIDSPTSPDIQYLSRIMRFLVRRKVFSVHCQTDGEEGEILYGLTGSSKWLVRSSDNNLVPMVMMETHPDLMLPWHYLADSVRDGGIPFKKTHGVEMWDFASVHGDFNKMFNDAMACSIKIIMRAIAEEYKDGFGADVSVVVDVGGGTGGLIAEIVKMNPRIKGINFDLKHVVSTAPEHDRVVHIGGSMFDEIPEADVVLLKWVLHNWSDKHCLEILKNCRKALSKKINGKLVIVDLVLKPEGTETFDHVGNIFDMLMLAHTTGGKERTEDEWKVLLEDAGFPRYRVINIRALPSIIEAFPQRVISP